MTCTDETQQLVFQRRHQVTGCIVQQESWLLEAPHSWRRRAGAGGFVRVQQADSLSQKELLLSSQNQSLWS